MVCFRSLAIRQSNSGHCERNALARHRKDCPACPLRAPTLCCAATSRTQGRISVDAPSSIGQSFSEEHEASMRTSSYRKVVPEGSYMDGHFGSHNGAAASSNGALSSSTHLQIADTEANSAEAFQASSSLENTAQASLKLDLDRERSLSSSSKVEAREEIAALSPHGLNRMHSEGSNTEKLQDMGAPAEADYVPPRERLKRLRERPDGSLDEKERLRRMRISAANKGRKPWNDGVRHKPGERASWQPHACRGGSCTIHVHQLKHIVL